MLELLLSCLPTCLSTPPHDSGVLTCKQDKDRFEDGLEQTFKFPRKCLFIESTD